MSIQGTLEKYELSEILLSLSMNQQTGTLTFTSPDGSLKNIYFQKGAIFVLYSEEQSIAELERLLVNIQRATARQMKTAIKSREQSHKFIGDILMEMGIANQHEILNILKNYIEDSLFSIFLEEKTQFEFHLNTTPPGMSYPLPETIHLANSHVLDCLNKISQWHQIRQYFPTMKEIYCFTQPKESLPLENLSTEEKNELRHLDGHKQIQQVFQVCLLSNIRLASIMGDLIQKGSLKLLSIEEAIEKGHASKAKGKMEEALDYYSYAKTVQRPMPDVHFNYAEIMKQMGKAEEAVQNYRMAADNFFDLGNYEQVLKSYMQILAIDASNIGVLEKLFDAYLRSAKKEETLQVGQQLGQMLVSHGDFNNAILIYSHLVKLFPREIHFRKELARCYQQINEFDLATQQLNIVRRIEQETLRQKKEKFNRIFKKVAVVVILAVVVVGGYFLVNMVLRGNEAGKAMEEAQAMEEILMHDLGTVYNFKSEAEIQARLAKVLEAWKKAESLGKEESATFAYKRLKEIEISALEEFRKLLKDKKDYEKLLQEIDGASKKKDYKVAFDKNVELLKKYGSIFNVKSVKLPILLNISPSDAQVFLNEVLSNPSAENSQLYYYEFTPNTNFLVVKLSKSGYTSQVLTLRNPSEFQNIMRLLDREINWKYESRGGMLHSPLVAEGNLYITTQGGYLYSFPLSSQKLQNKEIEQRWNRPIGIEGEKFSPLSYISGNIVLGNSQGEAMICDSSGNLIRKKISMLPLLGQPASFMKEYYSIAGVDGKIYVFKNNNGELEALGGGLDVDGPLYNQAQYISRDGKNYLLVASASNEIRLYQFYSAGEKFQFTVVWNMITEDDILANPVIYQDKIIVGNKAGILYFINFDNGEVIWRLKTRGSILAAAKPLGDNMVAVGNVEGELFIISMGSSSENYKVAWKTQLLPIYSAPEQSKNILYVPTSQKYRQHKLVMKDGVAKFGMVYSIDNKEIKLEDDKFIVETVNLDQIKEIQAGPFQSKGLLYAIDMDKKIEIWKFPTEGGLYGSPVVYQNQIIFGTSQGKLYSISQ